MNTNIGMSFLDLSQEEKEEKINKIVPSICSVYCCRENCNGCFIQELTDETFKNNTITSTKNLRIIGKPL